MTVPDYQSLMLPLLKFLSDGKEHKLSEAVEKLSDKFNLSKEEQEELLPSGQQPTMHNRVAWARTYLLKAGLLSATRRGYVKINFKGLKVLEQKPQKITVKFLEQFPEFLKFKNMKRETSEENTRKNKLDDMTPNDLMEQGYNTINETLSQDLLERLRKVDPYFLRKLFLSCFPLWDMEKQE